MYVFIRKKVDKNEDGPNPDDSSGELEQVHRCNEVIQLTTTVAQLKAEVQLLQLGCRYEHIARNNELVRMYLAALKVGCR